VKPAKKTKKLGKFSVAVVAKVEDVRSRARIVLEDLKERFSAKGIPEK
jgi:hypothetical protein